MVILDDGALIGRCRVRSLIFRASLFDVYSAIDDRGVAVCVLRSEHRSRKIPPDSEFNAELEKLRALRIDQFPRVLGGDRDDQSSWLVTEAIGGTVPIWTPGAAPVHWLRALLTLGCASADCFAKAGEAGIYHGGLTPECLRKWPNGAPCVVGMGAARLFAMGIDHVRASPRYCAPEQIEKSAVPASDRTDVYSMGMCLHAFISGCEPFEGAAGLELISLAQYGSPDLSLLRGTPDKLREFLARCCAKSAADRYGWDGFEADVGLTINFCQVEVPDATRLEIITEKINQLDSETLGKLTKRWGAESEDEDENEDENEDDRTPPAGNVAGPLIVPIAAPVLIASAPSNEAHRLTPEQPQAPPNEPSKDPAKEALDDRPPPLETPAVSPLKKQWKGSRAVGALAMLGGVCAALAIFTLSNIRPPVVSAPLTPSESQDKLEAVARRLLIEALTACKSGAQPKLEHPIETNSAEPDRPVLRPPPTLPRDIERDTLKGSCGTWFDCDPIFEESK